MRGSSSMTRIRMAGADPNSAGRGGDAGYAAMRSRTRSGSAESSRDAARAVPAVGMDAVRQEVTSA